LALANGAVALWPAAIAQARQRGHFGARSIWEAASLVAHGAGLGQRATFAVGALRNTAVVETPTQRAKRAGTVGIATGLTGGRVNGTENRAAFVGAIGSAGSGIAGEIAATAAATGAAKRIAGTEDRAALIRTTLAADIAPAEDIALWFALRSAEVLRADDVGAFIGAAAVARIAA